MTAASPLRTNPPVSTKTRMLPELELEVMKILWRMRSATVGDVHEDMAPRRPLAYTTVMTVMDRLFKKGTLRREKRSRAHVYEPTITNSEAQAAAVDALLVSFFGGSSQRLRSYLGGGQGAVRSVERKAAPRPIDDSLL